MFESTIISGQIYLGKQGEHCARRFYFNDVVIWRETFGEGRCELIHQRNGDSAPYPVALTDEDGVTYWCVSKVDTAIAGEGKCEIRYIVNDTVVKSNIYSTFVQESLGEGTTDVPEPQKAWVDQVIEAGVEAKEYAEQAVDSANNAEVAKTASEEYAEQSRIYAEQSEKNAQGVKEDAEYADLRASDAGASMQNAVYAAEQARGFANEAKGYSDNASAKAEEAAESAELAKDALTEMNATFANALKGVVSGVGAVRLDAISPVPHDIEVKTDVDTGFKSYGKNLAPDEIFDESKWANKHYILPYKLPEGITLKASCEWVDENDKAGFFYFDYSMDGGKTWVTPQTEPDDWRIVINTRIRTATITTKPNAVYGFYCNKTSEALPRIKNIQLELSEKTEYEPYKEPVDGVVAVYPTTTLMADNTDANIEATYNKDINKAFAELNAAIISLGGNI